MLFLSKIQASRRSLQVKSKSNQLSKMKPCKTWENPKSHWKSTKFPKKTWSRSMNLWRKIRKITIKGRRIRKAKIMEKELKSRTNWWRHRKKIFIRSPKKCQFLIVSLRIKKSPSFQCFLVKRKKTIMNHHQMIAWNLLWIKTLPDTPTISITEPHKNLTTSPNKCHLKFTKSQAKKSIILVDSHWSESIWIIL